MANGFLFDFLSLYSLSLYINVFVFLERFPVSPLAIVSAPRRKNPKTRLLPQDRCVTDGSVLLYCANFQLQLELHATCVCQSPINSRAIPSLWAESFILLLFSRPHRYASFQSDLGDEDEYDDDDGEDSKE
jgi:hypothetical protein